MERFHSLVNVCMPVCVCIYIYFRKCPYTCGRGFNVPDFRMLCCAVIGQICCTCGIATLRTCQEESCRDSLALSSASREQTCSSPPLKKIYLSLSLFWFLLWSLTFYSLSSFMFDEPSSYLDVKQRLRAAITIRSLISPDRSATHTRLESNDSNIMMNEYNI